MCLAVDGEYPVTRENRRAVVDAVVARLREADHKHRVGTQ